jgi:tetratricopeptide (TPR) repeat protein
LRAEAEVWLGRTFDVDRFLGAAWLLFDETNHEAAATALREYSRSTNTRISALATAQQWRIRLRESDPSDVELAGWRDHIEFIPREFRSGPQALLALGYQRVGQYEQAAAEWLWISTVYTEQDMLTARATLESGECLYRLGRMEEAMRLFTETAERFAWSPQAGIARQRLTEIEAAATE